MIIGTGICHYHELDLETQKRKLWLLQGTACMRYIIRTRVDLDREL